VTRIYYRISDKPAPRGSDADVIACVEAFTGARRGRVMLRPDGGKPRLRDDEGIFFSVSHTDYKGSSVWACAVSDAEVGFDVQAVVPDCDTYGIAKRFFTRREADFVAGGGDFFALWAAKESYVKYTGEGAGENFAVINAVENGAIVESIGDALLEQVKITAPFDCRAFLCHVERGCELVEL
jgi:hypothetical protein